MQEAIDTLNASQHTASYTLTGDTIEGKWNFDQTARGAVLQDNTQMSYRLIITLAPDMTYTSTEKMDSTQVSVGLHAEGTGPSAKMFKSMLGFDDDQKDKDSVSIFHASKDTFSGKTAFMKQSGFQINFGGSGEENKMTWNFDVDDIKKPIFALLESQGYKPQKKSFIAKIFGA